MANWNPQANDIFLQALEIGGSDDRLAYLQSACGGREELKSQVESLLSASEKAGSFLESPACPPVDCIDPPAIAEGPGSVIGPYKLLEQIGEGGMGVVFMAEQTQPVQRKVALKIVKPGMDTKQVIARFEAERQALALMDHLNIARVLDAGTTKVDRSLRERDGSLGELDADGTRSVPATFAAAGRPYFVMELVRGVPITEFCDQHKLTIRERLELFINVCHAVQHAHQKGIIHRDLKPTNVLVTLHDIKPVVKVIDFGVAKATGRKLTEKTLFTGLTQMIGTPLYMSPEQAEMSGLDVDTRSDIYSLGVLLYELLTGTTPFDSQRLKEVAFDELRRIIREEEPPRPSARLSSLSLGERAGVRGAEVRDSESAGVRETANLATTVAERRRIDPRHLSRLFQGELDWIVMKCLEKDRNRRYETASALAADVERYLQDEPVHACPPSSVYRFRKFASRNRTVLFTVAVVMVALTLGVAASSWQAIRAVSAEQQAKANEQLAIANSKQTEEVSKFLVSALRSPDPNRDGKKITVAELLDRSAKELQDKFADDARTKAVLMQAIADTYRGLGLDREAIPLLEQAVDLRTQSLGRDNNDTLSAMENLQVAYCAAGNLSKSLKLAKEILNLRTSTVGPDDRKTIAAMRQLIVALGRSNRIDEATRLAEETVKLEKAKLGPDNSLTLHTIVDLAVTYEIAGRINEANSLLEQVYPIAVAKLGPNHHASLYAMHNLAASYAQAGKILDAVRMQEELVRIVKAKNGSDDADTLDEESELAVLYHQLGRTDEALAILDETIPLQKKLDPKSPTTLQSMHRRMAMLESQAKFADAESAVREILELQPNDPEGQYHLGVVLAKQGKFEDAVAALRVSIRLRPTYGPALEQLTNALLEQAKAVGDDPPWDEITFAFTSALDHSNDTPYHGYHVAICKILAQSDEAFDRVAQQRPADGALWIGRAEDRALRSRWTDALADYEKVIHQRPTAGDETTEYAYLLVLLNKTEGFEQFCRELMARTVEPQDAASHFQLARAMGAAPSDAIDPNRLVEWASTAISSARDRSLDAAWLHCLGLAQYRAGQYEQAIESLQKSNASNWSESAKSQNWLLLAMANHCLAHADESKHCLETARSLIAKVRPGKATDRVDMWAPDWIPMHVLLREAEALLKEPTTESKTNASDN